MYFQFPDNCQIPNLGFIYEFFFGRQPGLLLEVGAYDGINFSNSLGLIERGWHANLYEPVPEFFEKCLTLYADNKNVQVYNLAISNNNTPIQIGIAGALSSANLETLQEYSQSDWSASHVTDSFITIPAITLVEAFAKTEAEVDLLIVDVEGYEVEVFHTFRSCKSLPKMIIVELSDLHPSIKASRKRSYLLFLDLLSLGYVVVYKDKINTIFCQKSFFQNAYLKYSRV